MQKNNRAIVHAYNKGYRVNSDGIVITPIGVEKRCGRDSNGYLKFNITFDEGSYPIRVHRLCAYQTYGQKVFSTGIVVRHLDNNKDNNSISNLKLGTDQENYMDIPEQTRQSRADYAASFNRSIDWDSVDKDRERGMSYREISKTHAISKGNLSRRYKTTRVNT